MLPVGIPLSNRPAALAAVQRKRIAASSSRTRFADFPSRVIDGRSSIGRVRKPDLVDTRLTGREAAEQIADHGLRFELLVRPAISRIPPLLFARVQRLANLIDGLGSLLQTFFLQGNPFTQCLPFTQ